MTPGPLQVETTCQAVFNYVAQGLFERHKLIVSTQLCMAVLQARGELQRAKFDMLLRGPKVGPGPECPPYLGGPGLRRHVQERSRVARETSRGRGDVPVETTQNGPVNPHFPRLPTCPSHPQVMGVDNPLSDWVPESVWGSVQALRALEDYASLPDDLVGSSKRWREWMELERPGGGRGQSLGRRMTA